MRLCFMLNRGKSLCTTETWRLLLPSDDNMYDGNQPEDCLNVDTVRNGYQYGLPRPINEYSTLLSKSILCNIRAEYAHMLLALGEGRDGNVQVNDLHKLKRGTLRDAFFIAAISKDKARDWFQRLSSQSEQVIVNGHISHQVPVFLQKEDVFNHLFDSMVPVHKAVLYIKLHAAHSCNSDPKWKRRCDMAADLSSEWTCALCDTMGKALDEIVSSSGAGAVKSHLNAYSGTLTFFDYLSDLTVVMTAENLTDHQGVLDWICERTVRHVGSQTAVSVHVCQRIMALSLKLSNLIFKSEYATRLLTFYSCSAIKVVRAVLDNDHQETPSSISANSDQNSRIQRLYELFALFIHRVVLDYPDALVLVSLPSEVSKQVEQSLVKPSLDQLSDKTSTAFVDFSYSTSSNCKDGQNAVFSEQIQINKQRIKSRNQLLQDGWNSDVVLEQAINHPLNNTCYLIDYLNQINRYKQPIIPVSLSCEYLDQCTSIAMEHRFPKKFLSVIKRFMFDEQQKCENNGFVIGLQKVVWILCDWALIDQENEECYKETSVSRIYLIVFALTQLSNVRCWNIKNSDPQCSSSLSVEADEDGYRIKAERILFESLINFLTLRSAHILAYNVILRKTCLLFSMLIQNGTFNFGYALEKLRFSQSLNSAVSDDKTEDSDNLSFLLIHIPIVSKAPNSDLQLGSRLSVLYGFKDNTRRRRAEIMISAYKIAKVAHRNKIAKTSLFTYFKFNLCVHEQYLICDRLCDRLKKRLMNHNSKCHDLCLRFELVYDLMRSSGCLRFAYFELLGLTFDTSLTLLKHSVDPNTLRLLGDAIAVSRQYTSLLVQQFRSTALRIFDNLFECCNLLLSIRGTNQILNIPYATLIVSARVLYRRLFSKLRMCTCTNDNRSVCPHIFKLSCPMYNTPGTGMTCTSKSCNWARLEDDEVARRILIHLHKSSSTSNEKSAIKTITEFFQFLQRLSITQVSNYLNLYAQKVHCSQHLGACWTRVISTMIRTASSAPDFDENMFVNVIWMAVARGVVTLPNLLTTIAGIVNNSYLQLTRNLVESTSAVELSCLVIKKILDTQERCFNDPFSFQDNYCIEDSSVDQETCVTDLFLILAKHLIMFNSQMTVATTNSDEANNRKRKYQHSQIALHTAHAICGRAGSHIKNIITQYQTVKPRTSTKQQTNRIFESASQLREILYDSVICEKNLSLIGSWLLFGNTSTVDEFNEIVTKCSLWNFRYILVYAVFTFLNKPSSNFDGLATVIANHLHSCSTETESTVSIDNESQHLQIPAMVLDSGKNGWYNQISVLMIAQQLISMFPEFARQLFGQLRLLVLIDTQTNETFQGNRHLSVHEFPILTLLFCCVDSFEGSNESILTLIKEQLKTLCGDDNTSLFQKPNSKNGQQTELDNLIFWNLNLFWLIIKDVDKDCDTLMRQFHC
ncbi:hypothetical protein ACOME3_009204 [Neoechinorhynchus agilis]